ncbi:MAG: TULIP family P47-like protein [Pseudomonadota bacterium]
MEASIAAVRARPDQGRLKEIKFEHLLELPSQLVPVDSTGSLAKLAAGVAAANAYTYGWDTVFAVRLPDVNRAIAQAKASPGPFSQEAPDASCAVSGRFGDWRVCGGDGTLLHFEVPIDTAHFAYRDQQYAIDGALVTIEVRLEYIAYDASAQQNLMLQTGALPDVPAVGLIDVHIPEDSALDRLPTNFVEMALLRSVLELWFRTHLERFRHIFASVEMNHRVAHADFQWLTPTHTGYAICRGATADTSMLGILCMTQGRDASSVAAQLSPNVIPAAAQAGFLISQERFLTQMVLPGLPRAFAGSSPSDFSLNEDGDEVVNTRPVDLQPIKNLGITYQPVMTQLNVRILGDEVIVNSVTRTDIALGTYSEVKVTTFQRLKLATKPDGSQTIVYEESRPAIKDHSTKSTESGEKLQLLLDIALALVALILVVLTGGAVLIVGLIIIGLLMGLKHAGPALIADAVGNKVSDRSPSIALLTMSATDPMRWAGSGEFELTELRLGDSLCLGGRFAGG